MLSKSVGRVFAQPAGDGVNPQHARKLGRRAHASHLRTWDAEAEGSEAEGHLRLHSKSEESLGYETSV